MQVVDASGNMFGYDSITVAGPDGKPKTLSSAIKLITLVRNTSGSTMTKGTIVYINGGSGNKPTIAKALATSDATSAQTYGVVQSNIANNKNGYVVVAGALDGLNTSAYAPGTQLYLSSTTAGTWTSTKQLAPAHLVYVGIVVRQHVNQGVVEVKIQNGYELDEIHDVSATSPLDGQVLSFESATSLWKPKTISTGITIGSTPIASGAVGRVLFEGTGNVVQESANFLWDDVNGRITINTTTGGPAAIFKNATNGLTITPTSTKVNVYSDYFGAGTDKMLILSTYANQANQLSLFTTGNIGVNTATDSGFKFDVNGTARVVNQFQVGSFTVGGAGASSTIVTTGRISAGGGITLYNPASGDNQDTGIFPSGGVLIKHANSSVATFATVGGGSNGTNVAINQAYNPGAGTGSVIGYSHNYSLYPSADNTISYTSFYSRAFWNSAPYYNRITGQIRGFLFDNSLYNTQKLIDVVAFYANGGRLLFTGDLPAASVTSGVSRGLYLNQTHTASANNDVLVGLDISPTYTNGAFTGVYGVDLRTKNAGVVIGSAYGYGALYGYANDGIVQVVDGGTSSLSGSAYATQIWLRPAGNSAGLNSNYWATLEQSTGGLFIQSGRYNSNIVIKTGRTGTSGNIYFNNAGGTMAMFFGGTSNFAIGLTTDNGYKFSVNGSIFCTTVTEIQSLNGLRLRTTAAGASVQFAAANTNKAEIKTNDGSVLSTTFNQSGVVGFSQQVSFGSANINNASAQLEIESTTKGFLPPRMTNAQMLAIATPAAGLQVFDTTNNKMCVYDGTTWQNLY